MDKRIYKYGGIVAIAIGSVSLYLGGVSESGAVAIVGGVFALAGIVAALLKA
jgi:hypothetical protein